MILDIFFRTVGGALADTDASPAAWPAALTAGTDAITKYGGAQAGMRTVLDALIPVRLTRPALLTLL